jgi:serine/threonine protein kinase
MAAADVFDLVGKTLDGKYAVESVADQGGFSTIYRAQHLVWHQAVAIKVFRFDEAEEEISRLDLLEGFLQEGSLLAQLSSKTTAVCQARDTGAVRVTSGRSSHAWAPFLVLEWLDGCSLATMLKDEIRSGRPPRSLHDAMVLLAPVARALALAHARGITHRDLKPSNIFVLRDPAGSEPVKLLDFAVAKVTDPARRHVGPSAHACDSLTRLFTPAFAAPEQFNESLGETGPWTDVFALALILVRLITGASPLQGPGAIGAAQHCLDPIRRPTPSNLGLPVSAGIDAVFEQAFAVHPPLRFASAGPFWSALHAALARDTASDGVTERQPVYHPPSGVRPAVRIASGTPTRIAAVPRP